jgi:RHS repeat-associated protein
VETDYLPPHVRRRTFGLLGAGTNEYSGWDRFGRPIYHQWDDYHSTPFAIDDYGYAYDYAGNRTVRDNRNATADSTRKIDQRYVYDGLMRLQDMEQGLLFTYGSLTNPTAFQSWTLDALGNWEEFDDDANGDSTWDLQQKRYHNQANEIDGNGGNSITLQSGGAGANWADPVHDLAGNMTSIPKPSSLTNSLTLKYDAWNRLVSVIDPAVHASNPIAKFQYDGLNRRIVKTLDANGDTSPNEIRHFYYNEQWQVLEERLEAGGTIDPDPINQYVWNPEYVDSLAMRYWDHDASGGPDTYHYYLQDANYNVTAIVNSSGAVAERYAYTPYGAPTILNGANGTDLDGSVTEWVSDSSQAASDVGNVYLFTGREYDFETGLQLNGYRYYASQLGRWINRDPIGYLGGLNLYAYVSGMPTRYVDSWGLGPNDPAPGPIGSWDPCLTNPYSPNCHDSPPLPPTPPILPPPPLVPPLLPDPAPPDAVQWVEGCSSFPCLVCPTDSAVSCRWVKEPPYRLDLSEPPTRQLMGIGAAMLGMGPRAKLCPRSTPPVGDIPVSRWGRPGLEPGDWVMKGPKSPGNYIKSGKWQPWDPIFRNQFAPYGSGEQFLVPESSLQWPRGIFGPIKGGLGQRRYWPK